MNNLFLKSGTNLICKVTVSYDSHLTFFLLKVLNFIEENVKIAPWTEFSALENGHYKF